MVDICMASIFRNFHVIKSVASLARQPECSQIFVCLNSYTDDQFSATATALYDLSDRHKKPIRIYKRNNEKGCSEKFFPLSKTTSQYIATCDDDIIYPEDYLKMLIKKANEHKCAVTLHGKVLPQGKIKKYYKVIRPFHFARPLDKDVDVDIAGTGVMLFNRNIISPELLNGFYDSITDKNMSDLFFSSFLLRNDIGIKCIEHQGNWVIPKEKEQGDNCIYDSLAIDDSRECEFINANFVKFPELSVEVKAQTINNTLSSREALIKFRRERRLRKAAEAQSRPVVENNASNVSKVSIIMTAYNTAEFIEEAVSSVLGQDYLKNIPYEFLVGVDCCEKTLEVAKTLGVKVFAPECNVGTYILRNSLVKESTGSHLFFFDSDDILMGGALSEMSKWNYSRFGLQNFGERDTIMKMSSGCFWISRELFGKIGGFQPWICGADSEFLDRGRYNNINYKTHGILMKRRTHPTSLTQSNSTVVGSTLRNSYSQWIKRNKDWSIPITPIITKLNEIPLD